MLNSLDIDYIYTRSKPSLDALAGNTILLTGGTGFFGKWFLALFNHYNSLSDNKIDLVIPSRNPDLFLENNQEFETPYFRFLKCDLQNLPVLQGIDYIIHAAADVQTGMNVQDEERYLYDSKKATSRILNQALNCKKLLFTSSGAVYGNHFSTDPLPKELDSLSPSTPYGISKVIAEEQISDFCTKNNIAYSIARCFSFIGPLCPLTGNYALGNFINDGLNNRDITILGNGKPLRSFLYMGDLVVSLLRMLTSDSVSSIYNIGSQEIVSIEDLAHSINRHFPNINVQVKSTYNGESIPKYVPSIDKALEDQIIREPLNFKDSLDLTVSWYQMYHS